MKIKKRFLLFISIVLIVVLFINSNWMSRLLYPISYENEMQQQAEKYNIEPQLIAAIIKVESDFKTGRSSIKGASGLMQLMPRTAEWIVEQGQFDDVSADHLLNSIDSNIELGAWYVHYLLKKFNNEIIAAIAAYNAGPGNVDKWLEDGTWDGSLKHVDHIPFGETRQYVQKVIYYYNKYKEIYPDL